MLPDLGAGNIAIYGLGAAGLIGVISMLLSKFAGKSAVEQAVAHSKHEEKQAALQNEIEGVTVKQKVLIDQIKVTEKAAEESKVRVDNIVKKASQEINAVLKEDNLVKIDQTIQDEWDDI